MFEQAVWEKVRWQFRGQLSVEDLCDLDVEQLDFIYQDLNAKVKAQKGKSLLRKKNQKDKTLELQINIVKHIVGVKLTEAEEQKNRIEKTAKKQRLMEILVDKQDEALKEMSPGQLQGMIDSL